MYLFAQILGFAGIAVAALSFQRKTTKGILFMQIISCLVFFMHFLLLGAYTGAVLNILSCLRSVVFYYKNKAWASSKAWILVFIVLYIVSTILAGEGRTGLFPMLGCCIQTVGYYIDDAQKARKVLWISSPLWMVYNYINMSIGGLVAETLNLASVFIALFRYRNKKEQEV